MASLGGMFGMGGQQPQPKGDIRELWDILELQSTGQPGMQYYNSNIVWQDFNPYPNLDMNDDPCWVFVDEIAPGVEPGMALNAGSPITDGLRQVLALYSGNIRPSLDREKNCVHNSDIGKMKKSASLPSEVPVLVAR